MTTNLLKTVRDLLDQKSRDEWKILAEELNVSLNWVAMVADSKIKDPGVDKIEKLYQLLSGKSLSL